MKPVLLVLAAGLGLVLFLQWRNWPPPPPVPPAPVAVELPDPVPTNDVTLEPPLPREDYAGIIERPLFLPDRRPPPEEPELEPEAPEPEEFSDLGGMTLTAVMITPQLVAALVRTPANPQLQRLRIGHELEGWTVVGIEPDRLLLERQGVTDELLLRNYASGAPSTPTRGSARQRTDARGTDRNMPPARSPITPPVRAPVQASPGRPAPPVTDETDE